MKRLHILVRPLPGLALVAALLWGASPAWACGAWSVVASPNTFVAAPSSLRGVTAISATNVWAVGSYFSSTGTGKTLIEHYC